MRRLLFASAALVCGACSSNDQQVVVMPALYCYQTIGIPECFDVPMETEVRRLIGYYGPPPANRGFYLLGQ